MKEYDLIAFGTGSSMNIVSQLLSEDRSIKVAVLENGPVGGICLTRGCIPSKMLLYPAELVHGIRRAKEFWINAAVNGVDFESIMSWVYNEVMSESQQIESGINSDPHLDLYKTTGKFESEYTISVDGQLIHADKILLCTGSRPYVPDIPGLSEAGYVTNEEFFRPRKQPRRVAIIGGSYVGLEFGFFLSMMGSDVYVFEMLPRIAPTEEPEVSYVLEADLSQHMNLLPNFKVEEVINRHNGIKTIVAEHAEDGTQVQIDADEVIVASGRQSNSDITEMKKGGIDLDERGWVKVNKYLETNKPGIWACGDALGVHMFKHAANYESQIVYYNMFRGYKVPVDFHAVPHAIFTQPEIGAVGLKEEDYNGPKQVGFYMYKDTAKGLAMKDERHFAKVIADREGEKLLGTHVIGPYASSIVHESIMLMNSGDSIRPIYTSMHIHPAVNEVLERAFYSMTSPEYWDDLKDEMKSEITRIREETIKRLRP